MNWSDLGRAIEKLKSTPLAHYQNYLGFYSSWLDGYYREPWAMMLPLDDHGFHRGDGVFEAVRIHERAFVDLQPHLERLQISAAAIEMELPYSLVEIRNVCVRLAQLCDSSSGILRLYVTRGPGGFSPNPREVVGHQLYAAITRLQPPRPDTYFKGVRAMTSTIAPKDPHWSRIKSCNYLPNVMMKKEVLDKGYDFALAVDGQGRVCEGPTENILIVSADGEILVPRFDYTLRGTTVRTVMRLATEKLKPQGTVKDVRLADLSIEDVLKAREVAFVGTTLGVLPVSSLNDKAIGSGRAGELATALNQLLNEHWSTDPSLRTAF